MEATAVHRPRVPALLEGPSAACVVSAFPMITPRSSLRELFETEEGPLLHFALGLVGRRAVAEELVQEAFLRLHPVWAEVENPRAWLYRSLRNLALNHLRDHRRETPLDPGAEGAHEAELPVEEMGRKEAVGLVRMLLAELPAEDRDLIRLKYQEDLRYQEIGRRTGLNAGNVGYKLHHLLKGLAEALRHAGVEGSQG
jgi:RNA polymerase sigma factor (sigma-70 family)